MPEKPGLGRIPGTRLFNDGSSTNNPGGKIAYRCLLVAHGEVVVYQGRHT